jgi:hypothetical protein
MRNASVDEAVATSAIRQTVTFHKH